MRSDPYICSGLHLHRGARGAPRQGAGHCPCLDLMGQQQLHLLVPRRLEPSDPKVRPSSLPAHAALSTSAFTATLSLRHHHRHHRHRCLRASVVTVPLFVVRSAAKDSAVTASRGNTSRSISCGPEPAPRLILHPPVLSRCVTAARARPESETWRPRGW